MSTPLTDEQVICLNNARTNLREAVHMIEKLAHEDRDDGDFMEVINRCTWAINYLYRAKGEIKP